MINSMLQLLSPHDATAPPLPVGQGPFITITLRHTHSRYDSSGRVISPTHRHLSDNTQYSQQTDRQTDRQAGRQTDRQTGRQAGRQAGRQTGRHALC